MIEVYTQNLTVLAMTSIPFNKTSIEQGITIVNIETETI